METRELFALVVNLLLLAFIIYSIKHGRLKEKYAIIWIISSLSFVLFSIWFSPIVYFARLVGISDPLNLLYIASIVYFILIILHFSFAISKLHDNYKILTQQLALLEEKYRKATKEK